MKREMDLELEKKLWDAADQMRGNISSEEYMHIVIGVMFLKHMSDKYNIAVEKIKNDFPNKWEYVSLQKDILANDYDVSFVIPEIGNWEYIKKFASKKEIGQILDSAFIEIEKANPSLKGLFNKNYNREEIDQSKLGNVISIFSNIDLAEFGEDIIGRTYEYFLGNFFKTQGSKGGEFYTPKSVVKMMVEILNPHDGLLYDPACGTGGMFVQAREHLIKTGKNPDSLIIYGQEYQNKTWQLANINLLIHGFNENNINLGSKSADSFGEDLWLDKMNTFDYVLANPPFNMKKWGSEKLDDDPRWQWGRPSGTANYAWLSLMISKLNKDGKAAIVLSNGSLSANDNSSLEIRKNFIESNLVEAIIALPDKLFYTTAIGACIWVFNKNKKSDLLLMLNCESFGNLKQKNLREITDDEIEKVKNFYGNFSKGDVVNEHNFAKTVTLSEISANNFSLVPGRYMEVKEEEIDKTEIANEIKVLSEELSELLSEFDDLKPKVLESIKKAMEK